ncbi:MAG: Stp1/IreP family PP2C-type Ser/Thr phosphatase [Lachnospiraceae bacterium]
MKTFSITDVGMDRKLNEDTMFTSENPVGNLPNLFIVADGMGGHKAGEIASTYAVQVVVDTIKSIPYETEPIRIFEQAIQQANEKVWEEANTDEEKAGMGTTIVATTIIGNRMYVANVGDSRLYIVGNTIKQITHDHSLVEEMVRLGEVDKEEAKDHPDKNVITRAIGVAKELVIDFFEVELVPGEYVLMCSDGLTNMVEDEEIRTIILGQRDTAEIAEKLIETANKNGGKDNVTVVIIEPFSDEVRAC